MSNCILAPIVLFVYNRPKETLSILNSLKKNILASESDLFIFSDAAKDIKVEEQVNSVRKIINSVSGFKSVYIKKADNNMGLAKSVINGVTQVIQRYGKVIVLEDDLITSPNFLSFMNQILDYYEKNKKIISVSGGTNNINIPESYAYDVYFAHRMYSWGWGTWLNRWENIDWELKDYNFFKYNLIKNIQFMRGGEDLPRMLSAYKKGKIDSWAIRFAYHQYKTNTFTVYPVQSKINNIGFGDHATNTKRKKKYDGIQFSESNCTNFNFSEHIFLNKRINNSFLSRYKIINRILANYIIK